MARTRPARLLLTVASWMARAAAERVAAEMRARKADAAADVESAAGEQKTLEQDLYDQDARAGAVRPERGGGAGGAAVCAYPWKKKMRWKKMGGPYWS
jgi:hypothetical protein